MSSFYALVTVTVSCWRLLSISFSDLKSPSWRQAVFDWRAKSCHSRLVQSLAFRFRTPGQRPARLRAISYQSVSRERKSVLPVGTEAMYAGSPLFKRGLSMMGFRTAR